MESPIEYNLRMCMLCRILDVGNCKTLLVLVVFVVERVVLEMGIEAKMMHGHSELTDNLEVTAVRILAR